MMGRSKEGSKKRHEELALISSGITAAGATHIFEQNENIRVQRASCAPMAALHLRH